MADLSRLSLDIADLPLTPFGMRSPVDNLHQTKNTAPTRLKKLSKLQAKSPTSNEHAGKLSTCKPKVMNKENAPPCTAAASRKIVPSLPQHKFSYPRPFCPVRKNSKLPPLVEEDSDDVFIVPSDPAPQTPASKIKIQNHQTKEAIMSRLKAKSPVENEIGSRGLSKRKNCDERTMPRVNSRNCSNFGQRNLEMEKRRDSQFTDIDEGSFIEFTSEIPDGRVIPHTDSLQTLRNNLYLTCPEHTIETEYSTSSKMPTARYNFHQMIGAVKLQHLQPQISEECRFSSTMSSSPCSKVDQQNKFVGGKILIEKHPSGKVLNSTRIDGKQDSEIPFVIPDISTLTLDDSPEDVEKSSLHQSNLPLCPTDSKKNATILPASPKQKLTVEDSSLITEDVLLASSNCSSTKIECLPEAGLKLGNEAENFNESAETEVATEDDLPPTPPVQSRLYQPLGTRDVQNVQVHASGEGKPIKPKTFCPNNTNHPTKSPKVHTSHIDAGEKQPYTMYNSVPKNVSASKNNISSAVHSNQPASPKKFQHCTYPSEKGLPKTPNLLNCKATSAAGQSSEKPRNKNSQNCTTAQSNLQSNNSPAILPKTSVCKWVINSPFKDSSFGTSFVEKLTANCKDAKITDLQNVVTVLETSDESSSDIVYSDDEGSQFHNKEQPNKNNDNIKSAGGGIGCSEKVPKVRSTNMPSSSTKVSVPAAAPKCSFDDDDDEFDQMIERASNLESLKLRLEASSRIHTTTLTLGRVAKQRNDAPDEAALPNLQLPGARDVDSNDAENELISSGQKSVSKNPFVTERKKKNNLRKAASKKLFESPNLKTKSNEGTNNELPSALCKPLNRAQEFYERTTVPGKGKKSVDESSDSDELTDYLSKWQKPQVPSVRTAKDDKVLADFFTDDESSGEEINYRIVSPAPSLKTRKLNRKETNSISELLPGNRSLKTKQVPQKEVLHSNLENVIVLSDSSDSLPSPEPRRVLPKPSKNLVRLSDSDDDAEILPPPALCKTPQPVKNKLPDKVCPKTDFPLRKKYNEQSLYSGFGTPMLSFLASLSKNSDMKRRHPDALVYMKNFAKHKEQLTDRLYKLFNGQIFDNKLPKVMKITWNVRMTKTAGFCYYQIDRSEPSGRCAKIELSTKVVDNCERLRDTLIHELCHAAAWIISGYKDGHGPLWRTWASRALQTFPELPDISRCHNYQIACKFTYQCTKCGYSIGRHSKSLDTERKVCGKCLGRFELLQTSKRAGPSTPRTPGPFALFVKENYRSVKKTADLKHSDVMKVLGEKFRQMKT